MEGEIGLGVVVVIWKIALAKKRFNVRYDLRCEDLVGKWIDWIKGRTSTVREYLAYKCASCVIWKVIDPAQAKSGNS